MTRQSRALVRIALATACILMLPLLAMRLTAEVSWNPGDFAVAGLLLFGAGLAYQLMARTSGNTACRGLAGIRGGGALLLVWVNLAVGIIGAEGNPANSMYIGVLAIGIIGALVVRFRPHGMARTLFAMALAQASVAVIALVAGFGAGGPEGRRDVLVATVFFVALWSGSSLLFRRASGS